MQDEPQFFDFAAEVGLTKHLGGVEATEQLVELCHIGAGSYVLDVGCGAGVTPCYLARVHGCRVVGVDILEAMIERSRERAAREGVADTVAFRVADAQDLPYEDGTFDAVITESVTSFPEDKQKAANEYVRVTRPGGYVGLNESTWLKTPSREAVEWLAQDLGGNPEPLAPDEWTGLLEAAGLHGIVARTYGINVKDEVKGIIRRYGLWGYLRITGRQLRLYARNPAYRTFLQGLRQSGLAPESIVEYMGYGVFAGRK